MVSRRQVAGFPFSEKAIKDSWGAVGNTNRESQANLGSTTETQQVSIICTAVFGRKWSLEIRRWG